MEDGAYTKSALSQAAGLAEVLSVSWLGPSWMLCVEWLIQFELRWYLYKYIYTNIYIYIYVYYIYIYI